MASIKYQEALGLKVKRGRPTNNPIPSKEQLNKLYKQEGLSIREIAGSLNCSKDVIHYWLKKYGIRIRPNARRSLLHAYPLADLKLGAKQKGLRAYARELGISAGALIHHLRVRSK